MGDLSGRSPSPDPEFVETMNRLREQYRPALDALADDAPSPGRSPSPGVGDRVSWQEDTGTFYGVVLSVGDDRLTVQFDNGGTVTAPRSWFDGPTAPARTEASS